MSPRPRCKGNMDLPPHVEANKTNGKTYYRYVLPDGSRRSLGTNKEEAVAAGLALNATLVRNPDFIDRILNTQKRKEEELKQIPNMEFAIAKFKEHLLKKTYAKSTRDEQHRKLKNYTDLWGTKQPNELTILDVAGFLNTKDNNAYIKHRALLVDLWAHLTHQGWAKENVPELTMQGIAQKKQRQRHNAEALDEIRRISPPWLQLAIDLARHSVQRRGDLVLLHKDMVNLTSNTITIKQAKSENYDKPVFMEIDMHSELRDAVVACLSDKLAFICPYLLHDRPKRMTSTIKGAKSKPHHLAITDDHLTKTFAEYRDKAGVYDHLTPEQKPSFHEIRAIGMFELGKKYNKEYANALAGHASMKMTEHYLEGHEPIKPVKVSFSQKIAK